MKEWLGFDNYILSVRKSRVSFGALTAMIAPKSDKKDTPAVKVRDITFGGIPARVYEPPAGREGQLRRGLMFFHGGGWALGTGSE